MNHQKHFVPLLLAASLALPALRAQGGDLVKEIQDIATRIDEQLQEIDRLLLESGKKAQPRSKPREMLQQSQERSRDVEAGIDELIQKLTEMKNSGGGGGQSQSSEQQQQQQDQQDEKNQQKQQGKGQQTRRENQTPDFVKQPQEGQPQGQEPGKPESGEPKPGEAGEKPGEQPGEKPGEQQQPGQGPPKGGQDSNSPGENRQGNRQLEPEIGPGKPGEGEGTWGELQSYTNFLKNRGSLPTVPPKYRKYWEAYLKSKQGGTTGSGGK